MRDERLYVCREATQAALKVSSDTMAPFLNRKLMSIILRLMLSVNSRIESLEGKCFVLTFPSERYQHRHPGPICGPRGTGHQKQKTERPTKDNHIYYNSERWGYANIGTHSSSSPIPRETNLLHGNLELWDSAAKMQGIFGQHNQRDLTVRMEIPPASE